MKYLKPIIFFILVTINGKAYTQSPYLSPDGDTLYIGDCVILKDNNIHHYQELPPEYRSNVSLNTIWGPDIRLTHLAERGGNVGAPKVVLFNNTLATFVNVGLISPYYNIYKTFSYDHGKTWTHPDSLTIESIFVSNLALKDTILYFLGATQGSLINVFFMRSFDAGYTWHNYHEFEPITTSYIGKKTLNAQDDSVFITYNLHARRYEVIDSIIFSSSTDRGETWSEIRGIIPMYNDFYYHWLKISRGRMHLVNADFGQGSLEIFYSFSDDFGLTWSDPIFLSNDDSYSSQWPYLSCDIKGNLCVSWFDFKYGSGPSGFTGDILYRLSHDNGETWGDEQRLTYDHLGTASRSVIDNNYICFVWIDHYLGWLHGNLSFTECYNTTSLRMPKYQITNNGPEHNVFGHELLYDGKFIYLFWQDDRDSDLFDYEIYFKRGLVESSKSYNPRDPENVLISPHPNPFNSICVLTLNGINEHDLKVNIYDITGRLVRTLKIDKSGKTTWDATDNIGQKVSSGLYFAMIKTPLGEKSTKLIYLK